MNEAVILPASQREWAPGQLTRVPFWIYSDAEVYRAEQQRIYRGPVWNYLCLEADLFECPIPVVAQIPIALPAVP